MQAEEDNLEDNNIDSPWNFFGEFLLDGVNSDEFMATELQAGSLFQALREWGIPLECIERIRRTMAKTVKGKQRSLTHSSPDLTVRVSLFSNCKTESTPRSGALLNGAWGYYLIERGREFLNSPLRGSPRVVELYLYKEGE